MSSLFLNRDKLNGERADDISKSCPVHIRKVFCNILVSAVVLPEDHKCLHGVPLVMCLVMLLY